MNKDEMQLCKQALNMIDSALSQTDGKADALIRGEVKRVVLGAREINELIDTLTQAKASIQLAIYGTTAPPTPARLTGGEKE